MPRQLRVFLCHASQDKPAVRKIYAYLKQHGIQPWLDREDLLPGQNWEVEIPKALFNSDVILVCLSKNSVNKEGYVQKEIVYALDKAMEKPQGTIFIIPVKLEDCEVPKRLSPYQWVDYFRPDGRKRLLMGLNVRAQELGENVSSVVMEDSKQRTPRPSSSKPKIKEEVQVVAEPKKEISTEIPSAPLAKQQDNKPIQRKPFTRILNPSSLSSSKAPSVEKDNILFFLSKNWITILSFLITIAAFYYMSINGVLNPFALSTEDPETLSPNPELPSATSQLTSTPKLPSATPQLTSTPELPSATPQLPSTPKLPTATSAPALGIGSTMISDTDGMVMVYVPEGEFTMGSNDGNDDEKPEHKVYLDAYWIDQTEVTNAMYAKCVTDGDCYPPSTSRSFTRSHYYDNSIYSQYPVVYVMWYMAHDYCLWGGRRLPSEAEWEKAARGTQGNIYPWGDENPNSNLLNYDSNIGDTNAVSSYKDGVSIYGAFDLSGNVWEWVNSLYKDYPYSENDGREEVAIYGLSVLRGGAWDYLGRDVRSTDRVSYGRSSTNYDIGFRCAMDATQ